jgi:hypothetical protein
MHATASNPTNQIVGGAVASVVVVYGIALMAQ